MNNSRVRKHLPRLGQRWHILETGRGFVVLRFHHGHGMLACKVPTTCKFTLADRRELITDARRMRMAIAQHMHGVGQA